MQKKIIALAVAGLVSGAAFAQTNVTIYGIMDAGVYGWSGGDESSTGVQSSGLSTSRLGFKGTEDLGNGLKAVFNLESAINLDDRNSAWASNRQANVGIDGRFGTVLIGLQGSLSDNWHGGVSEPMGNISSRNIAGLGGRFANEKADAVSYVSPMFGGLQLGALYGTKDEVTGGNTSGDLDTDTTSRDYYFQLGAKYGNGPIAAAVTYAHRNQGSFNDASKEWTAGMTYDFGVAKLYAAYERAVDVDTEGVATPAAAALNTRNETNSMWTLGARVPVSTAGAFSLSYSVGKYDVTNVDQDTKAWHLGYDHNLSKRTTVYAAYMHLANDNDGTFRPPTRYRGAQNYTADAGESYKGVTVGLRHAF